MGETFIGSNMFGDRVLAVMGNNGSCIISEPDREPEDLDDSEEYLHAISLSPESVERLAAWVRVERSAILPAEGSEDE